MALCCAGICSWGFVLRSEDRSILLSPSPLNTSCRYRNAVVETSTGGLLCLLVPALTFGPRSQDTRRNTAVPLPRACQTLGWGHNFVTSVEISADPQRVAGSACLKAAPGCWWSGNGIQRGDGDRQAAPRPHGTAGQTPRVTAAKGFGGRTFQETLLSRRCTKTHLL